MSIAAAGYLLRRLPLGLALLAAAGLIFTAASPEPETGPEDLPDHDYLPLAEKLAREEDYAGCIQLCEDIINSGLPNAERAVRLLADCEERRSAFWRQGRLAVHGFLTGDAASPEAAAGAVVSDLVVYGDVRDLSVQGARWVRGKPIDPFITAFSAVGLATELADWADWMPAVLKAFKRSGVISTRFSVVLTRAARGLFGSGAARKASLKLFSELSRLFRRVNPVRAGAILRGVDSSAQLRILSRAAEYSPAQLHLACRSVGGRRLAEALDRFPSPRTLRIAARKGPAGLKMLRPSGHSKALKQLRRGARLSKVFYSRHASALLRQLALRFPKAGSAALVLAGILALCGLAVLIPRRRVSFRSSDASSAPTNSGIPAVPAEEDLPESGKD